MQAQQDTCVRIDPPLCDQCHQDPGEDFFMGQWLCWDCKVNAWAAFRMEYINVR